MKAEYDFRQANQGAIITPPAHQTKICFYLDNASLRCLQEQGDLAETGYTSLLNKALQESLPHFFSSEETLQVRDLERFIFRLTDLLDTGEIHLEDLRTWDIAPDTATSTTKNVLEQNKRLHFHHAMAWLTTVNNLLNLFFQDQDILYVRSIKKLSEQMTMGTSVNKMTQIICILEELYFDVEQHVFNLDILHS